MFVASDVGGHRELVRDGETGFLFPAGDAAALARTIERGARARRGVAADPRAGTPLRRDRAHVGAQRRALRGRLRRAVPATGGGCARRPTAADRIVCGIYGILHLDGSPATADALLPMVASRSIAAPTTRARTPTGRCAFGMRRLSIIDVAGGHQPLTNEDGTLWLVANGEIYNYRELRRELEARGPSLRHRLGLRNDPSPLRGARRRVRRAPERHVRVRAVGRAPPAAPRRPRSARASSRSTCIATRSGSIFASEAKAMLALPGVSAGARRGCAVVVSRARLRAGAAVDLPRHPQAAAGDAADRAKAIGSLERRYWRVAERRRPRAIGGRMGRRACARGSRNRCACRW